MVGQTGGIQQLSAADKRVVKKIDEAKKRIVSRLKQAKEEAQDEIEKYRQEREKQFQEFKHMGFREDFAARIDADIKIKIEEMNKGLIVMKQAVIDQIFELIYDITPELLNNFIALANEE